MRIIHLLVVCLLVLGASYVYRIKMESTSRTERVQRLHAEVRAQRDAIAALRAEWAKLETPQRLQDLATRHLSLRPLQATQYDSLKNLPPRPPRLVPPGDPDPIRTIIESVDQEALAGAADDTATGSIPAPEAAQ